MQVESRCVQLGRVRRSKNLEERGDNTSAEFAAVLVRLLKADTLKSEQESSYRYLSVLSEDTLYEDILGAVDVHVGERNSISEQIASFKI